MKTKGRTAYERLQGFVLFVILFLLLYFEWNHRYFLSPANIRNVFSQYMWILILVAAQSLVFFSGGIDLSAGYQISLVSSIAGWMIMNKLSVTVIIPVVLAAGFLCGLLNGIFVTVLNIPAVLATISTQFIFQGISYMLSQGREVKELPYFFHFLYEKKCFFFPVYIWLVLLILLCVSVLFSEFYLGRYILAIGVNEIVAGKAGVPVRKVKIICYASAGILNACGAVVLLSRQGITSPQSGVGIEWTVVTALLLGMTLHNGRRGAIWDILLMFFLGVYVLAFLENGIDLSNWNYHAQIVVRGAMLAGSSAVLKERNYNLEIWEKK